MTLTELREKLKTVPLSGTYLRPEFEKFGLGGGDTLEFPNTHTVLVSLNYRCLDQYSDTQRVEVLGLYLNVYVDSHRGEDIVVTDPATLESAINDAIGRANAQCQHDYGRELSQTECREKGIAHYGNCYHVYECSKCKLVYGVDSSD
jgi:hypothetical protein